MTFLIALAAVVSIIALIITLRLSKAEDTSYSSTKSIKNQLYMYMLLIPVIVIVLTLVLVFL